MWAYINTGSTATTSTVTVYQHNDALTTHLATGSLTITFTGLCTILASSQSCLIVSQGSSTYVLYALSQSSTGVITFTPTDITTSAAVSPTKVAWRVNNDCSKFTIDSYIFANFGGSYTLVSNNFNKFIWLALDQTFTYALVAGAIWKYDGSSNIYKSYYTSLNATFTSGSGLQSSGNNIIVYKMGSTSALVNAFTDSGSSLTILPIISISGYKSTPKIAVSPQLSLFAVYGASNSGALVSFNYIDFTGRTIDEVDFPTESIFDPLNVYICLEETWLYVRQLASTLQTIAGGN